MARSFQRAIKASMASINILTLVKLAPCSAPRLKMLNQHVRSQTISGNGIHDNYGRGEKVSVRKSESGRRFVDSDQLRRDAMLRIRKRSAGNR